MLTNALGLRLLSLKSQPTFSLSSLIMSFIPQPTELFLKLQYTQYFVEIHTPQRNSCLPQWPMKILLIRHSRLTSWLPPLRSPRGLSLFCPIQKLWSLGPMDTRPRLSPFLLANELQEG